MINKYIEDLEYRLLDEKIVYKGRRLTIKELTYFNDKDKKTIHREHVLAGDAAVVLAINENNEVLMVKEPRTPIGKVILALPAGMVEEGEKPEDGALRELEEETGYRAKSIRKLRHIYPSVGYSNERTMIYLARDLVRTQRHLDETEDIEVIKVPLEKLKTMLDNNEIITASTTIALMHYFMYEDKK